MKHDNERRPIEQMRSVEAYCRSVSRQNRVCIGNEVKQCFQLASLHFLQLTEHAYTAVALELAVVRRSFIRHASRPGVLPLMSHVPMQLSILPARAKHMLRNEKANLQGATVEVRFLLVLVFVVYVVVNEVRLRPHVDYFKVLA